MPVPGSTTLGNGSTSAPHPQALQVASAGSAEPVTYFCVVTKRSTGTTLGVDVTYSSMASWSRHGVFVTRVSEEGAIASWNKENHANVVQTGDFIFQVNDKFGDTVSMIQELKTKPQLSIHILRRSRSQMPVPVQAAALRQRAVASKSTPPAAPAVAPPATPAPAIGASLSSSRPPKAPPAASPWPSEDEQLAAERLRKEQLEALLKQLAGISNEALAALICAALEQRPWLRLPVASTSEPAQPSSPAAAEKATPLEVPVPEPRAPDADEVPGVTGLPSRHHPAPQHTPRGDTEPLLPDPREDGSEEVAAAEEGDTALLEPTSTSKEVELPQEERSRGDTAPPSTGVTGP